MTDFALLILPAANRVYADASVRLTEAELAVFNDTVLDGRLAGIAASSIGEVPYVGFSADGLSERDVAMVSNLSAIYALFRVEGELLRPVPLRRWDRLDGDLLTIQKYPGKTNEQFTKLLLNVTLLASAFAGELGRRRFAVLDPLCGRGTTLNQALMYGFDAAGIDSDARDFDAYAHFIQTWLQQKRLKHQAAAGPVRRNRKVVARRLQVSLGLTKQAYRAGDLLRLTVLNAETSRALEFLRPESFDVAVADLPYGVQHGSRTAERGLSRGPLDLLAAALPTWTRLVRPGGALGLAWNTHVARREQASALLAEHGLLVRDSGGYAALRHRVDQAIVRDVLVARRP
jgi:SAM-dependent methyltransferase